WSNKRSKNAGAANPNPLIFSMNSRNATLLFLAIPAFSTMAHSSRCGDFLDFTLLLNPLAIWSEDMTRCRFKCQSCSFSLSQVRETSLGSRNKPCSFQALYIEMVKQLRSKVFDPA